MCSFFVLLCFLFVLCYMAVSLRSAENVFREWNNVDARVNTVRMKKNSCKVFLLSIRVLEKGVQKGSKNRVLVTLLDKRFFFLTVSPCL